VCCCLCCPPGCKAVRAITHHHHHRRRLHYPQSDRSSARPPTPPRDDSSTGGGDACALLPRVVSSCGWSSLKRTNCHDVYTDRVELYLYSTHETGRDATTTLGSNVYGSIASAAGCHSCIWRATSGAMGDRLSSGCALAVVCTRDASCSV
jgi:hypothetical protein